MYANMAYIVCRNVSRLSRALVSQEYTAFLPAVRSCLLTPLLCLHRCGRRRLKFDVYRQIVRFQMQQDSIEYKKSDFLSTQRRARKISTLSPNIFYLSGLPKGQQDSARRTMSYVNTAMTITRLLCRSDTTLAPLGQPKGSSQYWFVQNHAIRKHCLRVRVNVPGHVHRCIRLYLCSFILFSFVYAFIQPIYLIVHLAHSKSYNKIRKWPSIECMQWKCRNRSDKTHSNWFRKE